MCRMCDDGNPQDHVRAHASSRRDFLKASTATAIGAAGLNLLTAGPASAQDDEQGPPASNGKPDGRYLIRGGIVMSMDPSVGDFVQADVLVEGKKIMAVGPNLRSTGRRHRCARQDRDAGLHRHAPSPVRDGAAQLPRRRGSDQRWLGLRERKPDVFRIHPADVRPRVPPSGRLHQRALRGLEPARRRRHDGARRLADPSLAAALGCRDPGALRYGTARRLRLLRERGGCHPRHQSRQQVSDRRDPHQQTVVLIERPARHDDHGRRGLPSRLRGGLEHRARSRAADCGAHPFSVRHSPDARPACPEHAQKYAQYAQARPRQPVHPHDGDVGSSAGRPSRTSGRRCRSQSRSR